MTEADRKLLARIVELQAENARQKRPEPHGIGKARVRAGGLILNWEGVRAFGPKIAELSTCGYDDAARKRVSRTLTRLEKAGLVKRTAGGVMPANFTHVGLTDLGRQALAEAPAGFGERWPDRPVSPHARLLLRNGGRAARELAGGSPAAGERGKRRGVTHVG